MRVLILCMGNSARSQMAEGLLRYLSNGSIEVFSAGISPKGVMPEAVQVMQERGIDISAQTSKSVDIYVGQPFDYVITVCDQASELCPLFPGKGERIHWSFPDPAEVEEETGRLHALRTVRDGLEACFRTWMPTVNVEAVLT
ncbi:MAG: arsenate reductase ArsC [Anaerolineae bacterium]